MKKKILTIITCCVCIVAGALLGYSVYNDDRLISPNDLPASITEFVTQHFPEQHIMSAEIDFLDYKVWLSDNTLIEFEWDRNWSKIKSFGAVIPSELIPSNIASYIEQLHHGANITKISKEGSVYEVQIPGTPHEYRFNKSGQYIGLDD